MVEWVAVIGGALVVALLIRTFLFANFWIPSASMEPTLMGHPGRHDRVVVNKLSYKLHDVRRGDIVVFAKPPGEADSTAGGQQVKDFIKRVIALPGERVTIQAGAVYVDGKRLAEPYLPAGTVTDGRICGFDIIDYRVPKGTVFVMGDNRSNSRDSRCFASRAIKKSSIVGRAFLRIWPLSDFGGI
ncbi:MAG: signal peptidase I [Actinobacteria bacterium]|nr:signal peptidase I [Actinomycetota bacterium]